MKVISRAGKEDLALVYIAETDDGKRIEFVESVQPPLTREKKWVIVVSTLYGCPVGCRFCDAGGNFQGKLSSEEILFQIDYPVQKRFPDGYIPVEKFKIQFARMGEPSFNNNVLDVLDMLPLHLNAPGLLPSLSTIAPVGTDKFFEKLLKIKEEHYAGNFQFQYSIHTTDDKLRNWLIPVKTWSFEKMAEYGAAFSQSEDKKISLNFALMKGAPVDPQVLLEFFSPDRYLIKITPVNPTYMAINNNISSLISQDQENYEVAQELQDAGYDVIMSIGPLEENQIGSNCGQYLRAHDNCEDVIENGYTYDLQKV